MYGMVHNGISAMVVERFGSDTWAAIAERAGYSGVDFIGMQSYPDEATYALVAAACEELAVSAHDLLVQFGTFWICEYAPRQYEAILQVTGDTLVDFLANLDNMHLRIGLLVLGYSPPRFSIIDQQDRSLSLAYFSNREGLAPFVEGLLVGVGQRFHTPVHVEHTAVKSEGADHDVFHISW